MVGLDLELSAFWIIVLSPGIYSAFYRFYFRFRNKPFSSKIQSSQNSVLTLHPRVYLGSSLQYDQSGLAKVLSSVHISSSACHVLFSLSGDNDFNTP